MATPRALVVDWGGVLTEPLEPSLRAWAELDGIDLDTYRDVMASWLGDHQGDLATTNPIAALERGEIEVPHFEEQLAERLSTRSGHPVPADGLLQRMFDQFAGEPAMAALVLRARRAGLLTGLLSNSWGNTYPREGWDEMFHTIVISGEVGMRKPDREIFQHTLDLLGVDGRRRGLRRRPARQRPRGRGVRPGRCAPHVVRRDGGRAGGHLRHPAAQLRIAAPPAVQDRSLRIAATRRRVAGQTQGMIFARSAKRVGQDPNSSDSPPTV